MLVVEPYSDLMVGLDVILMVTEEDTPDFGHEVVLKEVDLGTIHQNHRVN